jgi:hypothetical protein
VLRVWERIKRREWENDIGLLLFTCLCPLPRLDDVSASAWPVSAFQPQKHLGEWFSSAGLKPHSPDFGLVSLG